MASGAAIFTLMDADKDGGISSYLTEIGLFGALVSFGLLTYELKGIQKCTGFIAKGHVLEKKLFDGDGQFSILNADRQTNWFASEPIASAIVYATVLSAWVYLACKDVALPAIWVAAICWLLTASWVVVFWRCFSKPIEGSDEKGAQH